MSHTTVRSFIYATVFLFTGVHGKLRGREGLLGGHRRILRARRRHRRGHRA